MFSDVFLVAMEVIKNGKLERVLSRKTGTVLYGNTLSVSQSRFPLQLIEKEHRKQTPQKMDCCSNRSQKKKESVLFAVVSDNSCADRWSKLKR